MSGRLRRPRPSDLTAAQRAVYDAITDGPRHVAPEQDGGLPGPFNAMLLSPAVGGPLQALGAAIRHASALPDRVREIAILTVATHHDSAYERHAHEAAARRAGLSEPEIAALRRPDGPPPFDAPVERVALDTVRALLRDGDLDDDGYARAVDALGEAGLFELTALVGYYGLLALQLRLYRVEPPAPSSEAVS